MEVKNKIRKYIQSNLVVFDDEADFTDSDNIFKMGFVNSLFAMKLVTYVESTFDIAIENDDLNIVNFSSVNNIVSLVEGKLKTALSK